MGVSAACDGEAMHDDVVAWGRSRGVETGAGDAAGAGGRVREGGVFAGGTVVGGEVNNAADGRLQLHSWAHSY